MITPDRKFRKGEIVKFLLNGEVKTGVYFKEKGLNSHGSPVYIIRRWERHGKKVYLSEHHKVWYDVYKAWNNEPSTLACLNRGLI